jgi:hypothetical protein
MADVLGFAVVGADGLLNGSGVQSVVHSGTGSWNIYFDFSVANACEVASVGQSEAAWISAYAEPHLGDNEVSVSTGTFKVEPEISGDGSVLAILLPVNADLTFQLAVFGSEWIVLPPPLPQGPRP